MAGQTMESPAGALAYQVLPVVKVRRRNNRAYSLALFVMLGRVHCNEHLQFLFIVRREVHQSDTVFRRINVVAGINLHDVPVACDGPESVDPRYRTVRAVNGILAAKTLKDIPDCIVDESLRVGWI